MRKVFWCVGLLASHVHAMDINTASTTQLMQLKGVGEKTAQRIVIERQRAGGFFSEEELSARVKGLSKKKIKHLKAQGLVIKDGKTHEGVAQGKIMYVRPRSASLGEK